MAIGQPLVLKGDGSLKFLMAGVFFGSQGKVSVAVWFKQLINLLKDSLLILLPQMKQGLEGGYQIKRGRRKIKGHQIHLQKLSLGHSLPGQGDHALRKVDAHDRVAACRKKPADRHPISASQVQDPFLLPEQPG